MCDDCLDMKQNIKYTFHRKKVLMWDVVMFDSLSDGASEGKRPKAPDIFIRP